MTSWRSRLELARALGPHHVARRRRLGARFKQVSAGHAASQAEEMWVEAANALGATVVRLSPTILEFQLGEARTHVAFRATTPLTDNVALELAGDKPVAYKVLSGAGLPVPAHVTAGAHDVADAESFLRRVVPPVLVKPVVGFAGRGVVGGVRTMPQLMRAVREASRYHRRVLVEQQIEGDTFRLLFLEGELLDVIRRSPPRVIGDGRSTVGGLLFAEYERRIAAGGERAGYKPFAVDVDVLVALENAGLELRSVPAAGESLTVRATTNYSGPEETETVDPRNVSALVEPARQAAVLLGVRLAGVDIVTTDPSRELQETGGVILEVNPLPGLAHHYEVADRACATRVAIPVLAHLLGVDPGTAPWLFVGAVDA